MYGTDKVFRYYWDFAPGYSYVDVATQAGHATFVTPPKISLAVQLTIRTVSFMTVLV